MRDTATYHFETHRAALDFLRACDDAGLPACQPSIWRDETHHPAHVLVADSHARWIADDLAGFEPAAIERGESPFERMVADGFHDHAEALAHCFATAGGPSQLYACIRFARRVGLLPQCDYVGGAYFDRTGIRVDSDGDFLNGSFDEYSEAADEFLTPPDDDDDTAAEYHDMAADGGVL